MTGPVLDYRLVRALQKQVADEQLAHRRHRSQGNLPELSPADEQQHAHSIIREIVKRHMQERLSSGEELPDSDYDERLRNALFAAIYGAGELQELLEDELVENIDINGFDEVWVRYAGGEKRRWRSIAASDEHLISIVQNLGSYAGINARPFSPATPELDVRLQDGSRLSAIMSATERPAVSIRRNRYPQVFLRPDLAQGAPRRGRELPPDLVTLGTVSDELADFLYAAVRARCNIIVGGATDAGKTTLLRALIHCIDPNERLVTVERALELGIRQHPELHHDVVEMEEQLADADGKGGIGIAALVRRSRRMNPDRVLVGEVLGPEVVEMLSAMAQGNDGSLSTIHARNADEVFNRIGTYAKQYEGLDFDTSHNLIAGAIDFVAYIEKNEHLGGRRCVTQVLEIGGYGNGQVSRNVLFAPGEDGRAVRDSEVAITPQRLKKLTAVGYRDRINGWEVPTQGGW